jgi:hypothetical protein
MPIPLAASNSTDSISNIWFSSGLFYLWSILEVLSRRHTQPTHVCLQQFCVRFLKYQGDMNTFKNCYCCNAMWSLRFGSLERYIFILDFILLQHFNSGDKIIPHSGICKENVYSGLCFLWLDCTLVVAKEEGALIMTAVKKAPKPPRDVQTAVYMLLYV